MSATEVYLPYSDMVRNLFKVGKQLGNECGDAMHAAIGICGEVAELSTASSFSDVVEECGDIEFYMEAYQQQFADYLLIPRPNEVPAKPLGIVLQVLVAASGDILDQTKKGWVYNKQLDGDLIRRAFSTMRWSLDDFYMMVGLTSEKVKICNQQKLSLRYPNGVYSDAAAQARADKSGDKA